MIAEEFNQKWSGRLTPGQAGMIVQYPGVIEEADRLFSEWSEDYIGFTYAQISLETGQISLFVEGIPSAEIAIGEDALQRAYLADIAPGV